MPVSLTGPTSNIYFSQRLRLHYVDWGNEEAPPLLLIHGGRDHCRNWDWVAQALRKDFHIIAPDLRGHGDSAWAIGGSYMMLDFVYDIAQLVRQRTMAPLSIMGHSMGGFISTLYTGLYPETVSKLVVIDAIVVSPEDMRARFDEPIQGRLTRWVDELRGLSSRTVKKYASIEECIARMHGENPRLSKEQARLLTIHGVNQNEDGTYSWKFDNYVRAHSPAFLLPDEIKALWRRISCPTLLVNGAESAFAKSNAIDVSAHFTNARVEVLKGAGHWVHHDKLDEFLSLAHPFLKG
jgi:pimeloyl-ACP methyl ester carboxylesterase